MISAGVIAAKVSWNTTNTYSGMTPFNVSGLMPARNAWLKPPTMALKLPSLKARL